MKHGKLAIDVSSLSRDLRGMGNFVREFAFQLARFPELPFEIALASENDLGKTFPFPTVSPKNLDLWWNIWFPFNHPTFKPRGRYVVTVHDLAPFVFPQGEARLRKKYLEGAKRACKMAVDSHFIAQEASKFLNLGREKIAVIPLGFDPNWCLPDAFTPPWPYVLAIGPAEPRKNFQRLIEAFASLKRRGLPHKLAIVGELPPWKKQIGPVALSRKNPLPQLAEKLGVGQEVIFPGPVSRRILSRWYRGASLTVVPSLYEGFGFPVLEAFSCGCPLACSRAASLPEVAGDGAFYFNPEDVEEMASVIEHALNDPAAAQRKKEYADRQVQSFSWDSCVRNYVDLFQAAFSA